MIMGQKVYTLIKGVGTHAHGMKQDLKKAENMTWELSFM